MKTAERDVLLIAELFDAQPESVVWFKPVWQINEQGQKNSLIDFEAAYCNAAACTFLRAHKEAIIGKRLFSNTVLDEASNNLIFEQCSQVYKTGEPQDYTYYNDHLKRYYNVLRSKVKDGVLAVSRDRTHQAIMEKELEKQTEKYNIIIDTSTDGVLILRAIRDDAGNIKDFLITHSNKTGSNLGKFTEDANGKTLLQVLPHLKNSAQFELHSKVVETGEPVQFETTFRSDKGEEYGWFIVSLQKLDDGLLSRFVDLSEKKENEQKILQQAELVNSILEASINGVFALEAIRNEAGKIVDLLIIKINKGFTSMIGRHADEVEGKKYLELFPSAKQSGLFDINCQVIETGIPVRKEIYYEGEGIAAWFNISLVKLGNDGLVVTFDDITEAKKALVEVEQHRNLLDNILRHSPSGISVTEVIRNEDGKIIDGKTIIANEAAIKYLGIKREDYLTKRVSELDPGILESAVFKMALNTLKTGEPFLTQYFVEAYGKWLELGVSKMDDDHLVNVFNDITDVKASHLKLEKLVEDLKRSNANLEEFTYAASHDLKEPVRKISIFTNRLKTIYSEVRSEEGEKTIERLQHATERMQLLIDDLLEYSYISNKPLEYEEVNLSQKIERVLGDLEVVIEEKNAKITVGDLPTVKGFRRQLQQLFQNLLSNSLKYSKQGIPPEITIRAKVVHGNDVEHGSKTEKTDKEFYLIEVEDNGIGFEQQYAERIFNMFQRLHGKAEYSGTGVGLSIARKVAENHNGFITAEGYPGEGAKFKVYLPV